MLNVNDRRLQRVRKINSNNQDKQTLWVSAIDEHFPVNHLYALHCNNDRFSIFSSGSSFFLSFCLGSYFIKTSVSKFFISALDFQWRHFLVQSHRTFLSMTSNDWLDFISFRQSPLINVKTKSLGINTLLVAF